MYESQKVMGRTPKIGYSTQLSHCKRNWDFCCRIVALRDFKKNAISKKDAYYSPEKGKRVKEMPIPPFWGAFPEVFGLLS